MTATTPAAGAVGVAVGTAVTVTFSEPVNTATLTNSSVTVTAAGVSASVPGTVAVSGTTATFTPSSPLTSSTAYTVTVSTAVRDVAGNPLVSAYVWSFTTAAPPDTTAPTIASRSPAAEDVNVVLTVTPTVTFSEPMRNASLTSATITLTNAGTGVLVAGAVTVSGNTATFVPTAPLEATTQYTMRVLGGVQDLAGNGIAAPATWAFRTMTPVGVSALYPANNATGVEQDMGATVTFTEGIDPQTLTPASFTLVASGGAAMTGIVYMTLNKDFAIFWPDTLLAPNTRYTATLKSTVRGVSGATFGADYVWSFTTVVSAPDVTAPEVLSALPGDGETGVRADATIEVLFSERMANRTLNGTTITVVPAAGGAQVPATIALFGSRFILTPSAPLRANTRYTVTISTGAKDVTGNPLARAAVWSFTTAP